MIPQLLTFGLGKKKKIVEIRKHDFAFSTVLVVIYFKDEYILYIEFFLQEAERESVCEE
jgi:hypothetical protein